MGQGDIGRRARRDGEGQADEARLDVVQAGGLGVEDEEVGRLQTGQPGVQVGLVKDDFVAVRGRGHVGCGVGCLDRGTPRRGLVCVN